MKLRCNMIINVCILFIHNSASTDKVNNEKTQLSIRITQYESREAILHCIKKQKIKVML